MAAVVALLFLAREGKALADEGPGRASSGYNLQNLLWACDPLPPARSFSFKNQSEAFQACGPAVYKRTIANLSLGDPDQPISSDAAEPSHPIPVRSAVAIGDAGDDSLGDQRLPQEPAGLGGPDREMDNVDLALGQRQVFSDLNTLSDRIVDQQRPVTNVEVRQSSQSNHLDITQVELSQDLFFNDGTDRLRGGVQSVTYDPKIGPGVSQDSFGSNGNYRFSDALALTGDLWVNDLEIKHTRDNVLATYDFFLTFWPTDVIRMDLDTSRDTFDNVQSLQLGLTNESVGGSIDYTPSDNLRLTVRARGAFYSDGNERQSAEVEGIWRLLTIPTFEIGLRSSEFSFSKLLNNGYFNPRNYYSGEGLFRIQSAINAQLSAEFAGSFGIENADPGGAKPLIKSSIQLSYKMTTSWSLDGGVSYFSSRESNSSGFARTSLTLGLHRKF